MWTTKSGKDILYQEPHDHMMISFSGRDGFNPFSEIISGNQDLSVLATGMWIDFSNEIQAPLLERTTSMYGF